LAQALLAERSAEEIAAALARLYRARLPSPEDIIDPGERTGRPREGHGRDRFEGGEDRGKPRSKTGKPSKHGMAEASVWFRAAIGRRKNAEARWLLPMICRRGGIDKRDIGAIRIMDTTTEFEISERVADAFAARIKRPDKEDSIRIEPMAEAPPRHEARRESRDGHHRERRENSAREADQFKARGKPQTERAPAFDDAPAYARNKKHRGKAGRAEPPSVTPWPVKGAPGKKAKKKRRG
jgi:ATP-dependent RNA helicase DeaD